MGAREAGSACSCVETGGKCRILTEFEVFPEAIHPIPKSSSGGVLPNASDLGNLFECHSVPESEDNDLTLFSRQPRQFFHGSCFSRVRFRGRFKPILALQFPSEAPPQAASTIQSPISKCPDKIVWRISGWFPEGQKGGKDILNHILGF